MTPLRRFEIHQPKLVADAGIMLAALGDDAGLYAGGTELLLAMRHGALRYRHLIDLKVIPGLDGIELREGWIRIGAGATHRSIERSPVVKQHQPVMADMESRVANVRVRASGTLGGNLCFAEPHSDPATLLLALDAKVETLGPGGPRELRIGELVNGAYSNSLQPGEILTTICLPVATPAQRAAYLKFQVHERPALGLALVLQTRDGGATISQAAVSVGCVCPFPRRLRTAEALLAGPVEQVRSNLEPAARLIADGAEIIDDHEGGADYKAHLIGVFLRRAFEQALAT